MAELSVLIPFRSDRGPRQEIFLWLLERYKRLLPEAEICLGSNEDEPFSRSKARNDAYRQATGDVFLIADADTLFHRDQVLAAVDEVRDGGWVLPYTWYYNLSEEFTRGILNSSPDVTIPEPRSPEQWEFKIESWAGLLIMPRSAYEEAKGYDERFVGWAFEDNAFRLALDMMVAPFRRMPGYALHLWHPVSHASTWGQPMFKQNRALFQRYERARDPEAMRRILEER